MSPAYDIALQKKEFTVSEVANLNQLVSMLFLGRTDTFISTVDQVTAYLKKINKKGELKMLSPPIWIGTTYLSFSKKQLKKMPSNFILEMEKKLNILQSTGVIENIHQKYKVNLYTTYDSVVNQKGE